MPYWIRPQRARAGAPNGVVWTILAAIRRLIETWASNLTGTEKLAMAGPRKRPNEHLVREATRPMAASVRPQRREAHRESLASDSDASIGSDAELQGELKRQELTIDRLRQRTIEI